MAEKTPSNLEIRLAAAASRDRLVREQMEKERADSNAKTVKLKALRLAREAAEREMAPPPTPRKPRRVR